MYANRPPSGRKHIHPPQSTFTAFTSCARLRNVQSLLKDVTDETKGIDAILCILGVDGRFNEGCRLLAHYLLFGVLELTNIVESVDFQEDIADDVIIVIKKDCVHVHYSPGDHAYLMPYLAHWRNLRLHCLTEEEHQADYEDAQSFKVFSFLEMVRDCPTVAVPYFGRGDVGTFDYFSVEKWPLVQAYGLEDFGMGGFFTMKHKVVDVSPSLFSLYDTVDPVALEQLVTQQLPLFERQWDSLITNVDVSFDERATFGDLSECTVSEPVRSFYSHGRVSIPKQGHRKPFVLFGQRSRHLTPPATEGILGMSGIGNTTAKHMICHALAPKSPLCCSRTFFLGSAHIPYPVTGGTARVPKPPKTDIDLLCKIYKVAIDAVLASIQSYGQSASQKQAEAACELTLQEGCTDHQINYQTYLASVTFSIEALDLHGNGVQLEEGQLSALVKLASLRVNNIPSVEHGNETLGSVLFAESFLDSRINITQPDKSTTIDIQCLILTSHIPRFVSWEVDVPETISTKLVETFTQSGEVFGKVLINGESVLALGNKELSTAHKGQLYLCEKGIIFQDSRHGVVIFPKSYFEEMQFFDGESSSEIACLVVTYRHSLQEYLPMLYHNHDDAVMFALTPKTKAHRIFYSEVISLWLNASDEPLLKLVSKVPSYFEAPYAEVQMRHAIFNKLNVNSSAINVAMTNLHSLKRFLNHLAVSCVGHAPIPAEHAESILYPDQGDGATVIPSPGEIVVTIVTGVPGSHKYNLCNILTNMAKEQNRWVTLRQPFDSPNTFHPGTLQTSLSAVLAATKSKSIRAATGGRKKMRVLIVSPGFADTADIVRAISAHPDPEVSKHVRVGAVTTCIDTHNVFMTHRYTFPKLLDQCAQGWTNNVLFTNSASGPDPLLSSVQELLRKVNPNIAFILGNNGKITRSDDVDRILSESTFMMPGLIRARYLLTPGWFRRFEGQFSPSVLTPPMTTVSLRFTQPLDRGMLLALLRSLNGQLAIGSPFTGNIYCIHGRTKFTESDQLMEVQYVTLSGYLSLTPSSDIPTARPPGTPPSPSPPCPHPPPTATSNPDGTGDNHTDRRYCFVFTGCGLEADRLRAWLRSTARQRPIKKTPKTREKLTQEETSNIHTKHHLEALPAGWFYNGYQYVSMEGERTNTHPDMNKFIDDYLETSNAAIERFNANIDGEVYHDLFD